MSEEEPLVIHLWTGPRSLSTAMLYAFAQRDDTIGLDEPLYASWLAKNPDIFRAYRDVLVKDDQVDGNMEMKQIYAMKGKRIIFCKHVAKQFAGLDKQFLYNPRARHIFLVRNPKDMIHGWERKAAIHKEACSLETMCLPIMVELFSDIRRVTKNEPLVVDSDLLKKYPREILTILCKQLDLEFQENMLKWEEGPKSVDGYDI